MLYEIKCAWCGKFMGTKEGTENGFANTMKEKNIPVVSHSMCEKCREQVERTIIKKGGDYHG